MKILYKFSLDVFSSTYISGWVYSRLAPDRPVHLTFQSGKREIGKCIANLLREDVKNATSHQTGQCGFSFSFPDGCRPDCWSAPLKIIVTGSGTVLGTLSPGKEGMVTAARKGRSAKFFARLLRKNSPASRVFFMHIPKTAGTSFNSFATGLYRQGEVLTHIEAFDPSTYQEIGENYRFVSGHLRMDTIEKYFMGREVDFYTLVREPHAQLHSHLNWLRGIGADSESAFYQAHHGLFKELGNFFGEKTEMTPAELQQIVDGLSGVLKKLIDNGQSRYFLTKDPETVSESDFSKVENKLKIFTLIGTTEGYHEFQKIFCEKHRLPQPPPEKPLNRSRYSILYDYKDPLNREIVQPLVRFDQRLYERVLQRNLEYKRI